MKKLYKIMITVVVLMILIFTMSSLALAATTVNVCDGQVSITDSTGNGSFAESTGTYTAKATGSLMSKSTNTITITNATTSNATIGFTYSASQANSLTIDGVTKSASGDFSTIVEAGSSFTIVLQSKSGISNRTATLTLTNIAYEVLSASNVTISFDGAAGTVTADGVAVATGDAITVEEAGVELVATAGAGARFIAWVDENGAVKSWASTYKMFSDVTGTVTALFSKDTPYFMVNANDVDYVFSDLSKAAAKGTKIVLVCDGTLPAGDYEIPAGKTLLIPFDEKNTTYTAKPEGVWEYTVPWAYRKLTMASGARIMVNGAISISAKHSSTQRSNGSVTGPYGHISMQEGSSITVGNGGNLYVWGYISGAGSIIAKSGATVYENFQVTDYRGGSATTDMLNNKQRVFPMSQYYVQNIEVPLTLEAGSVEKGYMSVYVSMGFLGGSTYGSEIPFIGTGDEKDGFMFSIQSGSITKDYHEATDRLVIDIDGILKMSSLSISMSGVGTIVSSNYTLPVNGNITLNVNSGSEINISQDMALLPGGIINVYNGAKCTLDSGARVFIYDADEWGGYCSEYNDKLRPVVYVSEDSYTRCTRSEGSLIDAEVYVEGVVDAGAGFVYTTAGGANIHGGEGALVMLKSGEADPIAYQATYNSQDKSTNYESIEVVTANLKNTDGTSYTDPEVLGDCCSEYLFSGGEWVPQNVSHTEVVTPAVEPTCTEEGKTEGSTCSACNTVIKEQETVPALGHSYGEGSNVDETNHSKTCACGDVVTEAHDWDSGVVTTPATHTATGVKTYTCSGCSATKTEIIEKLAGHTYGEWTNVDETNHSKICACGDVVTEAHGWDSGVVTTPATCKETGIKTFTCAGCGATRTEEIPADADNHTFIGFSCSVCGYKKLVTETTYTISDGDITISTDLVSDVSDDSWITIATFDSLGRLLNIVQGTAATLKEASMSSVGVDVLNVYVWDGVKVMTPISGVESIEL